MQRIFFVWRSCKMVRALFSFFILLGMGGAAVFGFSHPVYYTSEKIESARQNIEKFSWAQDVWNEIVGLADQAALKNEEELKAWIPRYTPTYECDCPYCNHFWLDFVWTWSSEKPDQAICRYCDGVVSLQRFPENDYIYRIDPQGEIQPQPVYRDSSGKIFPVRQLIASQKAVLAWKWIYNLGMAFALTREEKYARACRILLKTLAQRYPSYALHDNWRFGWQPWGWAGKLSSWHMKDATVLKHCAMTYDAIYHSKVLSNRDKLLIEKELFRKGGGFLIQVRPFQGISNDIAFRYAGVAMIGRILREHQFIDWVMNPRDGFQVFVDKLFYLDGSWHERTPAYHEMAISALHETPEILQGYSDPPDYMSLDRYDNINLKDLAKFNEIFSILFDMRLPDGTLPAINDSRVSKKPGGDYLEAMYNWTGEKKWLALLDEYYHGDLLSHGSVYSLFHRDPDIEREVKSLKISADVPHNSRDIRGMALSMLRHGYYSDQTVFTLHHHKYANTHSHYDALSTILFSNGREMLLDLGYPTFGSRLRTTWYTASLSHNTLVVDTNNQRAPNGVANFIYNGKALSAAEAESWDSYRMICEPFIRQIALIAIDDSRCYAVDIFRADGGDIHDWALHGGGDHLQTDLILKPGATFSGNDYAYTELDSVQSAVTDSSWRAKWMWEDGISLFCHFPAQKNCTVYRALIPGHRTREERGKKSHSLFIRRNGTPVRSEFVGIYEPVSLKAAVRNVKKIYVSGQKDWAVVLKVEVGEFTDYIFSSYCDLSPQKKPFVVENTEIYWQSRFGMVRFFRNQIIQEEWVRDAMEGLIHDF
ncbi:hypothetical protein GF407_08695 [candidate division KSB1 bacterium]|nr:hypothetical protein [candidate division KSB1 bacterium]